jgi:hypothetical protein
MKYVIYYTLPFFFLIFVTIANGGEQLNEVVIHQDAGDPENFYPTSWFNLEGLPPVGDQVVGGSCYAWAAAYYYLTHLQWQEYGWDVNDPAHQFSPAFVYNLTNGGVDNGASAGENARHDSFELLETLGCATMEDMPYSYTGYRTFPSETAFRNGIKFRTLSTHHIETRTDSGLQVLKDHLLDGNLAVMGIYGYQNLNNINSYNNIYCQSQATGGRLYWHEVTVVGYNDTLVTADGIGAFRLINEWGTGWGDDGFFWMSYEAVKHTQTSYGYVMYATDRIGYEPMLTARVEVGHSGRYNLVYEAGYGDPNSPDTLVTFFDFNPMSLNTGISYPDEATIVMDFTDMINLIQPNSSNEIFLRIKDEAPNNGRSGFIKSLSVEDLSQQLCFQSLNIPIIISDASLAVEEIIDLDYTLLPPQNLSMASVTLEGLVQLNWQAPEQLNNLLGYKIYLNGRLIDSTSVTEYSHFLSLRGFSYYDVTAVFDVGESPGAMGVVLWEGPNSFGIPFSENFENGFSEWYQLGSSGIPMVITEDPVYEGEYSIGIKSTAFDHNILLRPFESVEGVNAETWFNMASYPVGDEGVGGSVLLAQDGYIFGSFFDPNGHPGYVYTVSPNNIIPVKLDSLVTIVTGEWYKQKLSYYNGTFQFMLIDSNWDVILNRAINIPVQSVNQAALFTQALNNGWNYFDKFSIYPWSESNLEHFNPVSSNDNPYAFIITEATIGTSNLLVGDEIAVYDGGLCVGAVIVDGEWPLEMNAWGADSVNPGYIIGNNIIARLWSNQTNIEYETNISFEIGDGNFGSGLFSRVAIEGTNIVSVSDEEISTPGTFSISQNYPNPFNPSTKIEYSVPNSSQVLIKVFDILGNEVATLVNERKIEGRYEITFNASALSSGVYIYQFRSGKFIDTKKMVLLR